MNPLKSILSEYSKVQWPRKSEIKHATAWVIVMSVLLSIYLGVFDLIASKGLDKLQQIAARIGG
ncbi:MAG: preprotein translocase subunit SecE [Fusobacteriaceae bacterium]